MSLMFDLKDLSKLYAEVKDQINARISEFKEIIVKKDKDRIFLELMFCLLTPQSKARVCWGCVEKLKENKLIYFGAPEEIKEYLVGVRFKNKKSVYLVEARGKFDEVFCTLTKEGSIFQKREWLVENICGMGYKEASHFLRNIGLGEEIAILDRHILKNLKAFGVIDSIPKSSSKKRYLEVEKKMREFSFKINIPLSHLDLLLWYKETKVIFK